LIGSRYKCQYVQQHATPSAFTSSESWVILSPIEQSIKRKIEAVGKPLKDWDIQINYGIKTGCNEAFIIDEAKRAEILSNCQSDDERKRTEAIIRPILRGRDIRRYSYDWAGLYIIGTFPALKLDIESYPSLKQYFLDFGYDRLKQTGDKGARKKTTNQWFETQDSISYWEDFNKPKIMYPNMTKYMPFYFDIKGFYQNDKSFLITGRHLSYLAAFLNSSLFKFCFINSFPELQGGTRELRKIFFDKIPVLPVDDNTDRLFEELLRSIQDLYSDDKALEIDRHIFDLYQLTPEEVALIGAVNL